MYRKLVGRFIYLTITKPDLAYAVGVLSQFMHSPLISHLEAVHRIQRYLKSSPGKGILYTSNRRHLLLSAYEDADWAGSPTDRRSTKTTGYCKF